MRKKWISCVLAVFTLLSVLALPVMASEKDTVLTPVESDELGSITIQLEDMSGNRSKDGVTLGIVQVADVIDGEFVLKEGYEKSKVDLNKIYTANKLESAAEELGKFVNAADSTIVTDDIGTAEIKDLAVGVYLVYAIDTADYENIATSLVSIPTYNTENGTMIYDMELFPKHNPVHKTRKSPKTGDSSGILQYSIAGVVSLTLVIGLSWLHKRYEIR